MRVLLINPPAFNEIIGNNPSIIETERGYNPPLGLLYIASVLKSRGYKEVYVIDAIAEELSYSDLQKKIEELKPDITGITAMTFTLLDVIETLKVVKSLSKDIYTVLGGPHVNVFPEESASLANADFIVLGEGEYIFAELIDCLEKGKDPKNVPSLVYRDKAGNMISTQKAELIAGLDKIPHPARELTEYRNYSSILFSRTPVTTIFTSRGCPFNCTFCLRPHLGSRFRSRSPENILEEMKQCIALGISDFLIYDDTFTVIKKRVIETCELIIENKLDIRWDCRARIDTVDEELLKLMKKAGCTGIHYGIEAGTEKVLKNLKKEIDLTRAKQVCDLTRKLGIKTLNYFMIGSPGETIEDIYETMKVMTWLKADFVHITIFTPFPGTDIYLDGLKSGMIKKDYWKEFASFPEKGFIPPHWPENFELKELEILLNRCYKKFYLRPSYIIKSLFSIGNLKEFIKKGRAAFKIILMRS